MYKSDFCKVGDTIKFEVHVPIKEGYNYQKDKKYDGYILEHSKDRHTKIEFIGDDGTPVTTTIFYGSFNSGMESFEIIISDEEYEIRKQEWLKAAIEIENARHEKQIEHLKSLI